MFEDVINFTYVDKCLRHFFYSFGEIYKATIFGQLTGYYSKKILQGVFSISTCQLIESENIKL